MIQDAAPRAPLAGRLAQPAFWRALPERWTSDAEETLQCCQVRDETHDVRSFLLRSPQGRAFAFEPGQFITLELDIDGETYNRCYTISSSPTRPHTLTVTVKRVPGGIVSNWLHDHLRAGMSVRVLGPAGNFTCARHPASRYLFLSAGSGITPLMSMSRAYHELGEDPDIVFVHSARTPGDIVFARELDLMAAQQRNFRTSFVCERVGTHTNWPGITGFLSLPLLRLIAPDFMTREIFTCGPVPYMKAVRALLDEAGFERQRYHEESFSFDAPAQTGPMADRAATDAVAFAVARPVASVIPRAVTHPATSVITPTVARPATSVITPAVAHPATLVTPPAVAHPVTATHATAPGDANNVTSAITAPDAAPTATTSAPAQTFTIDFARSHREVACAADQSVLDAARAAGVRLSASCAQGMCGTCKTRLVSGQVDMQHNGGIRQREIDQGMVLLCCSKPLSDLVIDR